MYHWIWQQPNWPNFTWNETELLPLLATARQQQGKLIGMSRLLDPDLSLENQVQILIEDGINTSAIEGETIQVDAIRSSIARHLGLPTAGLATPPRAVDGLVELLIDATSRFAEPLTLKRLLGWQAALFPTGYSGLYQIKVGSLRGEEPMQIVSGPFGREKIHFEAPPRLGLEKEMQVFLDWFNNPPDHLDGLIRAGLAHLWFVIIHPFEDGNGRLGRAITDMAIAQDEKSSIRLFSLSAQIMRERNNYYKILEKSNHHLDVTPWLAWFLQQVTLSCIAAENQIETVLAKARFWLKHKNTFLNEKQRKVLNRLLNEGENFKGGMNTRKYMSLTYTSRATAYRELADLVAKGCLEARGSGRSVSYIIRKL